MTTERYIYMNYPLIFKLLGNMFKIEAVFMVFPLVVSLVYGEYNIIIFILPIIILLAAGFSMTLFIKPKINKFALKDAFAAAALTWALFSFFGALPFYLSGALKNFADCMFESIAGFTTTGTTLISDIENVGRGILFWRSSSVWIGGVGVLMFMMAVMPSVNASSINLFRAESTSFSGDKITPKIRETVKIIYFIYIALTVLIIILLIISGLPVYDSFIHAFTTVGSGGFSSMNKGLAVYNNPAAEIIITVFMFLVGVNFTLYYFLVKRNLRQVLKDEELRYYFGIVIISVIIMTINVSGVFNSVGESLKHSAFQVTSVISTTGFTPLSDVYFMPSLSQFIVLFLMFTGCCAGSTGGGIKIVRVILILKTARAEINKIVHPKSVKAITINGKKIDDEIITKTFVLLFLYLAVFFISAVIVSFEGKDMMLTISSVISMLSNVGVGITQNSITGYFSSFSVLSKIVFSFCMIIGRLEFFPVLILLRPSVWVEKKS